jgi:hypothetical protein
MRSRQGARSRTKVSPRTCACDKLLQDGSLQVNRLVSRRTAVINQMRAFLLEQGMVFAQKPAKLKVAMADMLENVKAETLCLEISLRLTPKSSWKLT